MLPNVIQKSEGINPAAQFHRIFPKEARKKIKACRWALIPRPFFEQVLLEITEPDIFSEAIVERSHRFRSILQTVNVGHRNATHHGPDDSHEPLIGSAQKQIG